VNWVGILLKKSRTRYAVLQLSSGKWQDQENEIKADDIVFYDARASSIGPPSMSVFHAGRWVSVIGDVAGKIAMGASDRTRCRHLLRFTLPRKVGTVVGLGVAGGCRPAVLFSKTNGLTQIISFPC
jgi:hypothetical protein